MRTTYVWKDEAAIEEFLRQTEIGHLTTIDPDGWPHTVPLNFLWQGGSIFFHTGLGDKIEHLRQNPKVAFSVTEALSVLTSDFTASPCRNAQLGRSVLIRGLAREIKSPEQKAAILTRLVAKYDPAAITTDSGADQLAPEVLLEQPGFQATIVVEIETAGLAARRHLLPNKPEKYRKAVAAYFQKRGQDRGDERDLKTALLVSQTFD